MADLSVPAIIAWLEQQDPAQTYDYGNPRRCLLAQHLVVKTGKPYVWVGALAWYDCDGIHHHIPPVIDEISRGTTQPDGSVGPWTFGAALGRAKEMLP